MKKDTSKLESSSTSRKKTFSQGFKVAPLSSTFMITSMIGFLISVIYIPNISIDWAFSFSLIFILMFISSMISMTRATTEEEFLDHLAIHEPKKHLKHLKKK